MDCSEFKTLLPSYLVGEGSDEQRASVEAHGRACPACARLLQAERELDDLVRRACARDQAGASELTRRIRRAVRAESAARRRPPLWGALRWLVPLGAAAVVMVCAWLWYRPGARADHALYRAAVADHVDEVVNKRERPDWRTSTGELSTFAFAATGTADVLPRLALADCRLVRARACRLGAAVFAHFVYEANGQEFSVYVRREHASLGGPTLTTVGDRPVRGGEVDDFESVGFQTADLTVLIVADASRDEVLRLARRLVEQLA